METRLNIAEILKDKPIYERRFWSPVGLKIGKLSVIKEVEPSVHPNGKKSRKFECVCECGNHAFIDWGNLKRSSTISCGHCGRLSAEYEVIQGERYGRLTVVEESESTKDCYGRRVRMVKCKCDCGNSCIVPFKDLRYGNSKSCGCLAKEVRLKNSTTHGLANRHPLYGVWKGIKSRCLITTSEAYKDYGGRGITICKEWRDNFKVFFDWCVSHGWHKGLSIDRIDNNKGYSPDNCRFADVFMQARNKRNNHEVIYKGEKWHSLAQFCQDLHLDYKTMYQRIKRGLTIEQAVTLVYRGHSAYINK